MDQPVTEAVILAGGLGTRLKSITADLPKPLAAINGRPFLNFVLDHLIQCNVQHIVLSVGYQHEKIQKEYGSTYKSLSISYAVEERPLGTGGALKLAMKSITSDNFFMLNGDTLFDIQLQSLAAFHQEDEATVTLAAKGVKDAGRYGTIEADEKGYVLQFREKTTAREGLINGGVYCINTAVQQFFPPQEKFSFEKDVLEQMTGSKQLKMMLFDDYFIDIGIPEDYERFKENHP